MRISIGILTATRAEYGLLKPIIKRLKQIDGFVIKVIVTGAHLSSEHGLTYQEIEKDGIIIDKKIDILLSRDNSASISKSMGLAMIGFGEYFEEESFDYLLVLGDRYETLAVCCAAMNARIPILHLYGGEVTEGAVDEAIRHSITKMSYLHFTSTEVYRRRVIQLGEAPERVFNVGAIGVENALAEPKLSKAELAEDVGLSLKKPYGLVTFHPVTLEDNTMEQCMELLKAIEYFQSYQFIITGANADCGGKEINKMLSKFADLHENLYFTYSLGMKKYLSALNYASFVIGNSSSGLAEAPSFRIPTINIGSRQKGRLKAKSVIDCEPVEKEIVETVKFVMSPPFQESLKSVVNPYGDGNTSGKIASILQEKLSANSIDLKKTFYDIQYDTRE